MKGALSPSELAAINAAADAVGETVILLHLTPSRRFNLGWEQGGCQLYDIFAGGQAADACWDAEYTDSEVSHCLSLAF